MSNQNHLTLGSLFDGIGGFPYAASFYGIRPLWASEIVPACVAVTKRHFPDMVHLGDITQLHGGTIPPVDILTFGSPCQGYPEGKNIPKFSRKRLQHKDFLVKTSG